MPPSPATFRLLQRSATDLEEVEVSLLLEGIYRVYGFDFRDYVRSTLRRRIRTCLKDEGLRTVSSLQERLLRDARSLHRFVRTVASNSTSLFWNPASYRAFRSRVVPDLRQRPRLRFWHLGCATGEEVYSMAVVLHEEGLDAKSRVYATELDEGSVRQAQSGVFALERLKAAEPSYRAAGGRGSLSDYYRVQGGRGVFRPQLRRNVVFASHNPVTDGSFNEFDVILCRNVLPSLRPSLQGRVHRLIRDSLASAGVLALGRGEELARTPFAELYEPIDPGNGLFRRVG
jgi:chemotaxis protein methyltransferase CheR